MQPQGVSADGCRGRGRAVRADGCCGGETADLSFEQRSDLGCQRRVLVRRVALAGSAVLAAASLALLLTGGMVVLADRLAWAATTWMVGLVLGWVRQVVTGRRLDWRLLIAVAAVASGVVWQPLVAALAAVVLLAERVARPPRAEPASPQSTPGIAVSTPAGQTG